MRMICTQLKILEEDGWCTNQITCLVLEAPASLLAGLLLLATALHLPAYSSLQRFGSGSLGETMAWPFYRLALHRGSRPALRSEPIFLSFSWCRGPREAGVLWSSLLLKVRNGKLWWSMTSWLSTPNIQEKQKPFPLLCESRSHDALHSPLVTTLVLDVLREVREVVSYYDVPTAKLM